jgi:DNA polymerase-3 subunit epsilon
MKDMLDYSFDFITLDFETANYDNSSACSMGMVFVKDKKIVDEKYFLIQPPSLEFGEINIGIHGITPDMVKDQPKFPEIWAGINHYFDNNIVIAHNASFDMSVLKSMDIVYDLKIPDFFYMCSIPISNCVCEGISKSLKARAAYLGINIDNHHNSLDDAIACANLVIETINKLNFSTFDSYLYAFSELNIENYESAKCVRYFGTSKKSKQVPLYSTIERVDIKSVKPTVDCFDTSHPFCGKCFVFTGRLANFEREDAMQHVVNLGGKLRTSVSGNTDYLVVGWQDKRLVGEDGLSSSEEKAYALLEKGKNITILTEDQFIAMLDIDV